MTFEVIPYKALNLVSNPVGMADFVVTNQLTSFNPLGMDGINHLIDALGIYED